VVDTTGSSATGSVYDFYNWATGSQLRVVPTVVASVTLPNPRSYYSDNQYGLNRIRTPRNDSGLVTDALRICAPFVDWTVFDANHDHFVDMLWVVHPGIGGEASLDPLKNDLWSITSQLSSYWYDSQTFDAVGAGGVHTLIDRFSILPELSFLQSGRISEIGVFCHEFGHAADFAYPARWLMPPDGPGCAVWIDDPDVKPARQWRTLWRQRNDLAGKRDKTRPCEHARDQIEWAADGIAEAVTGKRVGYCGDCLLQCFRGEERPAGLR